ncbi:MAG: ABC transporter permease [Burkholderiaceae bacterium]
MSVVSSTLPAVEEIVGPTPGQQLRKRIFGHRGIVIGGTILGIIVLMAVFAPLIAPFDPYEQILTARLKPPVWKTGGTWVHPLGTDQIGRDYLSRVIYGAQISLMIGFLAAILSGIIGTALGVAAGYFGGKVDLVVTFLITCRLSLPVILVSLAVVAIIGGSLQIVILVLGLLLWDRYAVVMRASTLQVRALDYVAAAQAAGCSTWQILTSEILPNVMNQLIVIATLEFAHAVLLEAALSFLGLGVQPPLPSWGLMIAEGRNYILFDPWLIAIPGTALFLLLLAVNLLGDGVRDVTAPENRS